MNLKKTLIAAAVTAVVAAPAISYADATLYGTLHMSMQSIGAKTDATKSELNFGDGPWTPSRFGVKGSDDMGNGMSSFFDLELGVAGPGHSTSTYGSDPSRSYNTRKALVGVKGNFGAVAAGRMGDLFYNYVESVVDPTSQVLSGLGPFGTGYAYRVTGLAYMSPNLSGFDGGIAIGNIGTDNDPTSPNYNKQQAVLELGGKYTFGPGFVSVGYINVPSDSSQIVNYKSVVGIGGGYNFGMFGIAANVMKTAHSSNTPAGVDSKLYDITSFGLQGTVSVGAIDGYLMFSGAKSAVSGSKTASRIAAGLSYAVSKPLSVAFEIADNNKYANAIGGSAAGYQTGVVTGVSGFQSDTFLNTNTGTTDTFKSSTVVSLSAAYSF